MLKHESMNQGIEGSSGVTFSLLPLPLSLKPLALSLFFIIFCLLNANILFAATVNLSWNPPTTNTDSTPLTDLAGYKVYYGTTSGYYTQSIDINNAATTTYQVNNLTDGTTYYFAITAYNTSLRESDYSNEQCFNSTGNCNGDTQAPTVPTGLSAQAISSSQINLSWTASTDNIGVTGYRIYRCTGSSCTPSNQIATSATNSYSNTGLSASTAYTYAVSAYDAAGNVSSPSASATATTSSSGDTQAPTVPTGLSGQAISSSQINLSWAASTDNIGVTGYRIYRCIGSNCTPNNQIATSTTNSYSNTGLSASTTYTYRVSAYDAAGNVSSQSASATATTLSGGGGDTQAPTVPTGLSGQAISSSEINLSWAASTDNVGVTGYRIYLNGVLIDTSATNSYSDTGLSASTTYTYSVSAYDAAGNDSSQSSSVSSTTLSSSSSGNNLSANSSGDSEISGGGCGFVKDDNGKGPRAKGEGLSLIMMLIIALAGIAAARRVSLLKNSTAYKTF
jgi:chitodextrinase